MPHDQPVIESRHKTIQLNSEVLKKFNPQMKIEMRRNYLHYNTCRMITIMIQSPLIGFDSKTKRRLIHL